jgi:hypothetical protein
MMRYLAEKMKALPLIAAALILFMPQPAMPAEQKPPEQLQKEMEDEITKTREELKKRKAKDGGTKTEETAPEPTKGESEKMERNNEAAAPAERAEKPEKKDYTLLPLLGAGSSFETYTGYTPYIKIGAEGTYKVDGKIGLDASITGTRYNQTYIVGSSNDFGPYSSPIVSGGGAESVPLAMNYVSAGSSVEDKYDLKVAGSMKVMEQSSESQVRASAGYHGLYLDNNLNDLYMHGLMVACDSAFKVAGNTGVDANLGLTYRIARQPGTISLMGTPWASLNYGLSAGLKLDSKTELKVGYDGEAVLFESVNRFYNGVVAKVLF